MDVTKFDSLCVKAGEWVFLALSWAIIIADY